ncbi:hypothetical protein [Pyrodictium delaneyi]|uniref:Uncharacterized protein n=1 Tax=Pyrodictium delaneyi TaxID=1273541 RepID=A0A211YMG2_9CREN|nr:hypothetical protein [Pyrodictium delaneyi]OWJ54233.1 hypothetical protein Pdsh_07005 [Pyrodictium delaneyi]
MVCELARGSSTARAIRLATARLLILTANPHHHREQDNHVDQGAEEKGLEKPHAGHLVGFMALKSIFSRVSSMMAGMATGRKTVSAPMSAATCWFTSMTVSTALCAVNAIAATSGARRVYGS